MHFINTTVEQYVEEHKLCSELMFEDWNEFLTVLYENGGKVKVILWWDYCKAEEQYKSIGGGGYRDSNNPEYMWAETMIYDNVSNKTVDEIREYIRATIQEYKQYHLYPSFYLE